jgi:hypothetical protein
MITVTKVKVDWVKIERGEDKVTVTGGYSLITSEGTVLAKQSFNGYNDMKFDFDKSISRNLLDEIESTIEIEIGVQEAVKTIKGA